MSKRSIACLGAAVALCILLLAPAAQADFGIESFSTTARSEDGSIDTLAGSHPYEYEVAFAMNQDAEHKVEGTLTELFVDLPPGLVGNTTALPRCGRANFVFNLSTTCPGDTQVGYLEVEINGGLIAPTVALYNLTPTPGAAATLGTHVDIHNAIQDASVRSGSDYGVTVADTTLPTVIELQRIVAHVWGLPMAPSHDNLRFCIPEDPELPQFSPCSSDTPLTPFLTLPASCTGPLATTLRVRSLEGGSDSATALSRDEAEEPVGLDGCNQLDFEPSISSQPTTNLADSPTGLDFDLHQAQEPPIEVKAGEDEHKAGQTEICQVGAWGQKPSTFAYRWLRNGAPIAGANAKTYVLAEADAGTALQCEVIASNAAGAGHAVSLAATVSPAPGTAPPVAKVVTVSIKGSGGGEEATCSTNAWQGEPSFTYQWFKNGVLVPGQTTATYHVPGPPPYTLQCELIATNAGGAVAAFSLNTLSSPGPSALLPEVASGSGLPGFTVALPPLPRATSPAKDVSVTLPAGMSLNPSAANGLDACSEAQIGYLPEAEGVHFSESPQSCTDAAKIGTVEATSPLLDHAVNGAVYVAKPFDNPFGSLLAIYLALEDPATGIVAKLAGKVEPDPSTGQLRTTFLENPQLPIEDVRLHIFNGARAALKTPLACGEYTTTSSLTPWSSPEGEDESPEDSFEISAPPSGGSCPESEAQAPNSPSFSAGTITPQAGAFSPFVLKLSRADGSQQLTGIDTALPPGLSGKLAGVPYCPEAQIAQAKAREEPQMGRSEEANPSCPAVSEVGTAVVGAGAGPTPFYATGHAYLAGPYEGAPLSLLVITPAVAGPFDLGAVVVRTALRVDPETAQIHAVSDPFPHIIDGIPLDIRSIALKLDRNQFTLNPTSCEAMSIAGGAATLSGQLAPLNQRFQAGGCNALPFKPKLSLSLKGKTGRGGFPALRAVLSMNPGEANIARAQVTLPHGLFIANAHIGNVCTRVQFAQGRCPSNSVLGTAKAVTPLLEAPLEGPVYLMSGFGHLLPDVAVDFHGQVDVFVHSKVDKGKTGGLRNTFEVVPDAPVSSFTLQLFGGRRGLLENSEELCLKAQRAQLAFTAHSARTYTARPKIKVGCGGGAGRHKRHGRRGGGRL
ncbi:MAG TPA: hypothetical protein VFJ64_01985 [Solirubrobacterales bacterium]|nr:hypothetical protein [Solirubrobacterales bacterium]